MYVSQRDGMLYMFLFAYPKSRPVSSLIKLVIILEVVMYPDESTHIAYSLVLSVQMTQFPVRAAAAL